MYQYFHQDDSSDQPFDPSQPGSRQALGSLECTREFARLFRNGQHSVKRDTEGAVSPAEQELWSQHEEAAYSLFELLDRSRDVSYIFLASVSPKFDWSLRVGGPHFAATFDLGFRLLRGVWFLPVSHGKPPAADHGQTAQRVVPLRKNIEDGTAALLHRQKMAFVLAWRIAGDDEVHLAHSTSVPRERALGSIKTFLECECQWVLNW